ncbi:hypothetical protein CASFOL_000033 [Castilleja foliolosa]|uniref:Importin N-terminal domain-containing protein n=1 Tax=Castilleja foliolosa TaxID=1961234 RepID=A0ABD3EMH7_9LAMI
MLQEMSEMMLQIFCRQRERNVFNSRAIGSADLQEEEINSYRNGLQEEEINCYRAGLQEEEINCERTGLQDEEINCCQIYLLRGGCYLSRRDLKFMVDKILENPSGLFTTAEVCMRAFLKLLKERVPISSECKKSLLLGVWLDPCFLHSLSAAIDYDYTIISPVVYVSTQNSVAERINCMEDDQCFLEAVKDLKYPTSESTFLRLFLSILFGHWTDESLLRVLDLLMGKSIFGTRLDFIFERKGRVAEEMELERKARVAEEMEFERKARVGEEMEALKLVGVNDVSFEGKIALEITQLLLSTRSRDAKVRNKAETTLGQFRDQNLADFLLSLWCELSNEGKHTDSRILSGIVLKNSLDARWVAINNALKSQIKNSLLNILGSSDRKVSHTAAQVVSKIASIEVPRKEWPELFGLLLDNMTQPDRSASLKQATLETLGYVCEEISNKDLMEDEVEYILAAVTQGMNVFEQNAEVCLAAVRALYIALGLVQTNFLHDTERTFIVKVICDAAMAEETKIREAAFGCLVSIASTYYDVLQPHMPSIVLLTSNAINGDKEAVALQAVDFWSAICEKEMEIQHYEVPHYLFIEKALSTLVPKLLDTLLKQDEDQYKDRDQEDGIWNLAMASGTCLCLVARTVGDAVVPLVKLFVQDNVSKIDWPSRVAATYALGSILEGPSIEKLLPMVNCFLKSLLSAMEDHNSHVKNTTAWTLSRIFELVHSPATCFSVVTSGNLQRIIHILLKSLQDAPHVAEKVCGAIYFLANGYQKAGRKSLVLMPYLPNIFSSLTECMGSTNSKTRSSASKTLSGVVMCLNLPNMSQIIVELLSFIMSKLEQTLTLQILSSDDREKQGDLQASLCGVLQVIIHKLGSVDKTKPEILKVADQINQLFLHVFACRSATVHEEDMLAIGALAYATGPDFGKYMQEFYKYLEMGLQNLEDYQVCASAVGVVGEICRALDDKILPYSEGIMTLLLKYLSSDELHWSVKPLIFACFGDIALAIGEHFEKYVISTLEMMQSASEACFKHDNNDKEMIDYGNQLKRSFLEGYSLILQGLKKSKPKLMVSHIPDIKRFLKSVAENPRDKSVTKAAVAVLGDLADALGSDIEVKQLFRNDTFCSVLVEECLQSNDKEMKKTAKWTQRKVMHVFTHGSVHLF